MRTRRPWKLIHPLRAGVYSCAGCGTPLYKSGHKFDSGCGWPAFYGGRSCFVHGNPSTVLIDVHPDAIPGAITRHEDTTHGMERIEIVCTACGGHLGHVFKGEGFPTPTDERHCVNSVSLTFKNGDGSV